MASKSPARMWMTILGVVLVLVAILGLVGPAADLMHDMTFHIEGGEMVLHWILAAATLGIAFGVKDEGLLATITIVYGAVYLIVGALGFFIGTPDAPVAAWHVGIADNMLHIALGIITMVAGFMTRNQAAATA